MGVRLLCPCFWIRYRHGHDHFCKLFWGWPPHGFLNCSQPSWCMDMCPVSGFKTECVFFAKASVRFHLAAGVVFFGEWGLTRLAQRKNSTERCAVCVSDKGLPIPPRIPAARPQATGGELLAWLTEAALIYACEPVWGAIFAYVWRGEEGGGEGRSAKRKEGQKTSARILGRTGRHAARCAGE